MQRSFSFALLPGRRSAIIRRLYESYCKENDRQAHGKSVFLRLMKDKGYRIKRTSEGFFFMDVSFKEPEFMELDTEEKVPFDQIKLNLDDTEGGIDG